MVSIGLARPQNLVPSTSCCLRLRSLLVISDVLPLALGSTLSLGFAQLPVSVLLVTICIVSRKLIYRKAMMHKRIPPLFLLQVLILVFLGFLLMGLCLPSMMADHGIRNGILLV